MTDPLRPVPLSGRARALLHPILIGVLVGLAAVLLAGGRSVSTLELIGPCVLFAAALVALYAVRVGRNALASGLMIAALMVCGMTTVLGYGSVRSVGTFAFVGAVVVAGLFHGRRVLVGTVVASVMFVGVSVYAESSGAMLSLNRPISPFHGITLALTLALVGFALHYSRSVAIRATESLKHELRERRQAEATIRRTEERLRLSMEATRQGWFDLDLLSGQVSSSAHFAQMMGADPERPNMTQGHWMSSIHEDERAAVTQAFQECLLTGETRQMEYRLRTLMGSTIWVRSIAKVVQWDEQQRPVRMTGTHADITAQMQVTLALRQSEKQYRLLVERSPVAILVQRDGVVVYANAAAIVLLAAPSADAVVGTSFANALHPDDREETFETCAPVAESVGGSQIHERRFLRHDGTTIEVSVQCAPITFEGASAVQLSCTDISARSRAAASLLQSRKLEALGTLASGIAHDFNNILLAVRGNAELAAAQLADREVATESLQEITQASARASEIVRRITAFGRAQEPNRERLDLRTLIAEVLRLLRPTIPAGILLTVQADGDVPPVCADAAQLHEVLVNLTANAAYAIGYTAVGAIVYSLDAVQLSAHAARALDLSPGRYVQLTVSDTGCGMDDDTMARAFDAFYTTKAVGEGSGLGLSMVYGIAKSHGGAVVVESAPGSGARFRIFLPEASTEREPEGTTPVVTASPAIRRRVLFVDDEEQLVTLARRTLGRAGHHVECFSDPIVALEAFRRRPQEFDLIITDLTMPRLSGLSLARAARAIRSDVRVAMVTGDADAATEAELEAAGIESVFVKASSANQLVGIVERACGD